MLANLFGTRTFLDRDLEAWCLESWGWLLRNLGGHGRLIQTPLVLANAEFFPPIDAEGHERALYIFGRVQTLMGMNDWPCELRAVRTSPQSLRVGEYWSVESGGRAAGTFEAYGGKTIISYSDDLILKPRELIAVFAHELCHYLIASITEPIPGGEDAEELLTDLTVAYSGFGLFGANAAFNFEQHGDSFSQGWRSSRSGYLSERSWAFALAVFLALKNQQGQAASQLKPEVAQLTAKAEAYLTRKPELLSTLRA